jgi:hypothetical protein
MLEHLDYETSKAVEQQLDTFIEKRAREKADANRVEELWASSEAYEHRQRENREAIAELHWPLQGELRYRRHVSEEEGGV